MTALVFSYILEQTTKEMSHPVRCQVEAPLLALSERLRQGVRITENQLHFRMTHQHASDTNKHFNIHSEYNLFDFLCAS